MCTYSFSHLPDPALLRHLAALLGRDCATTAEVLACLAEVDDRKLYLPAGYPSLYAFCVAELHLSEDAAYKRIQTARAARRFPLLFPAVAEGRLHLTAVGLLAPHLTPENVEELVAAATHRSKAEIERLLAQRFPRPDLPERLQALPASPSPPQVQLAPAQVGTGMPDGAAALCAELAPAQVETPVARAKAIPLSPERYALQVTIGQETHEKLQYAQDLLGHQLPSGDLAKVLDRALDALIEKLERRKTATSRPRHGQQHASANPRHIPAQVKHAVWERDGGCCTFISQNGHRCPARRLLEFDHVEEVARGGRATVEGIRLRCRAHNQYTAECSFGAGFMHQKREEARRRAETRRQEAAARAADNARRQTEKARAAAAEVIPYLRHLGFRAEEARRAAEDCASIPDASLEERVRLALTCFGRRPQAPAARIVHATT